MVVAKLSLLVSFNVTILFCAVLSLVLTHKRQRTVELVSPS